MSSVTTGSSEITKSVPFIAAFSYQIGGNRRGILIYFLQRSQQQQPDIDACMSALLCVCATSATPSIKSMVGILSNMYDRTVRSIPRPEGKARSVLDPRGYCWCLMVVWPREVLPGQSIRLCQVIHKSQQQGRLNRRELILFIQLMPNAVPVRYISISPSCMVIPLFPSWWWNLASLAVCQRAGTVSASVRTALFHPQLEGWFDFAPDHDLRYRRNFRIASRA